MTSDEQSAMSDIVSRLRGTRTGRDMGHGFVEVIEPSALELVAADEIERLRSLLKEAREALDALVMAHELPGTHCELEQAVRVACKFLSKIKGEV